MAPTHTRKEKWGTPPCQEALGGRKLPICRAARFMPLEAGSSEQDLRPPDRGEEGPPAHQAGEPLGPPTRAMGLCPSAPGSLGPHQHLGHTHCQLGLPGNVLRHVGVGYGAHVDQLGAPVQSEGPE